MAESQLECMEDGTIGETVPESRPEFYYSEVHRVALEELLRNGYTAFKKRLDDDEAKNFLSESEISVIQGTVEKYGRHDADDAWRHADDASLRSTYWPQVSDTDVPPLDIGWPQTGFFKGVTRVMVHAHPPKDNGPHIKEVVRRLIQEAHKVIAIVMDSFTDLQILQDLLDAASKRSVAVYIILDSKGVQPFCDMCRNLKVGPQHLQNIRTRMLRGVGIDLAFGRIPGSLCNKYMLIDGDKVMFGSYSFSWSSSRMDRNIITIMSGQIVDFFDRDFRELYAMSCELNLFKEFKISKLKTAPSVRLTVPTRPTLPATSRFQVSLGDKGTLKIPAHKYHNPKYLLALGRLPEDIDSPQDLFNKMEESIKRYGAEVKGVDEENEVPESHTPLSSVESTNGTRMPCVPSKKKRFNLMQKSKQKGTNKTDENEGGERDRDRSTTTKATAATGTLEDITESPQEPTTETPSKKKRRKKRSKTPQREDQGSENDKATKKGKKGCVIS